MKKLSCLLSFLLCYGLKAQEVYFTSSPSLSPDGQQIVFSYDGDLWSVDSRGGTASRLTAMEGNETYPRVSPDGRWVAFTSDVMGNSDIYIMPLAGGEIKRLTFHSAYDRTEAWSWDSQTIYFRSNRENRLSAYQINIDGGTPKRLVDHYFNWPHNLAIHPDGRIFFNESWESSNQVQRKRYKGAFNPDLKTYQVESGVYEQLTTYEGKDMWPTIDKKGNTYFVSDRANGQYNLYKLDKTPTAITNFNTSIKDPQVSADGNLIVFEKDYQLFTYNPSTQKTQKIKISLLDHSTLLADKEFNTKGNVTAFDVSQDQKKIAFVSRGALFVSDISGKFIKQLPTHASERVIEVKWLKDGETILYTETYKGYSNLFKINAKNGLEKAQLTSDEMFSSNIELNHQMTQAAYLSGRNEVRLLDLESFESTTIAREELWGLYNPMPRFSPDDKYLAFTVKNDFEEDIYVYNISNKELQNITKTGVAETNPFWSPDGQYIYFETNRTQPSYPFGLRDGDIYRVPLKRQEAKFKSDALDQVFEDQEKEANDNVETVIDLDIDVVKSMERVGARFGSQGAPFVIKKKEKTSVIYYSNHDENRTALWVTSYSPFEKPQTKKIEGSGYAEGLINIDGTIYLNYNGTIQSLSLSSLRLKSIDTEYKFRKSLRDEFDQMFYETWAGVEENFYNETFHDMNWEAIKNQYSFYLPFIKSRSELRILLNDMLGELNSSHMGFNSRGDEDKRTYETSTASLGLRFDKDRPYQVAAVIHGGPFDYPNKSLQPGDELIAVNDLSIDPQVNRAYYLSNTSIDDEVKLSFKSGKETKVFKIHPQSAQRTRTNLYDEWVNQNQELVDQKSNERVAYVHMKNMGGGELQNFLVEMTSEAYQRDGLILDLRYNTGGNVHDEVLKFLSQKPYLQWKYREGKLTTQANFGAGSKPTILLINEQSLSDAEMTSAGFKELGLGKIIGTETYRWIIFTSSGSLVDGSYYRLPSWGCYTLDGKNLEKVGVAPDIIVKNTFEDRVKGKDPQLERAIQEIMNQLK